MSFGLLVIAINIGYLVFAIIVGVVLAKLLKKSAWFQKRSTVLLSIVLFLLIFLAPFYDLLIQKGIKTYYEVFDKTYAKIYAYPEKDSEGRVESLGVDKEFNRNTIDYLKTNSDRIDFKNNNPWVKEYIENYFYDNFDENKTEDFGYARVYLNKSPITYEKIESPKDFKARYQVLTTINSSMWHEEIKTTYWDKKKNKKLAETLEVSFPVKDNKNKFRYKYLHWHGANGGYGFSIDDINNIYSVYRKLFIENNLKKGD